MHWPVVVVSRNPCVSDCFNMSRPECIVWSEDRKSGTVQQHQFYFSVLLSVCLEAFPISCGSRIYCAIYSSAAQLQNFTPCPPCRPCRMSPSRTSTPWPPPPPPWPQLSERYSAQVSQTVRQQLLTFRDAVVDFETTEASTYIQYHRLCVFGAWYVCIHDTVIMATIS